MKIFIPSYGRAGTMTTPECLQGLDWFVIVHDSSEYMAYSQKVPALRLLNSHVEVGIAKQRNWILDNLVSEGEWFCFMDDNIKEFWRVHPEQYQKEELPCKSFNHAFWDRIYRTPTSPEHLLEILEETRAKAEAMNACFAGFATTDNPFFRKFKWRTNGYVSTKAAIVKKTALRFDERFFAKDDMDFSANNLNTFGAVLVNNYVYPKANHYDPGGIGPRKARLSYKISETQLLLKKWPHLCSPLKRKGSQSEFPEEVILKYKGELNVSN